MKYEIEVDDWAANTGLRMSKDADYSISMKVLGGSIFINANSQGLIELARLFLYLAQPDVPSGIRISLDESFFDEGTSWLTVERI